MAKDQQFSWDEQNIVEDIEFQEEEAHLFRNLLEKKKDQGAEQAFSVGSILKGNIVEITKDHVVVDVGLKSEGLVPINEFSDPTKVALGEQIEVLLDQPEDESGQIVLSREKAERLRQWEHILSHCEEGSIVKGRVLRKVKGGLMVDIGMEAFLPGSQIDNKRIKNLDDYLGKTYDFKILKINIDRKNVVISRRELLEAERMSKKVELLENIKEGDTREGSVKNITDFGAFLDLDGIDGLLHITDMTWKRIKHPSELVHLGQKLQVIILSVDRDKQRVALGLKQKETNPWNEIEKRYPISSRVKGKIVNLLPYGAFIELEPGIEGLIHVSEMSWDKNITDPKEVVSVGQEVEAVVISVQKEEGKISLGLKQIERNPWNDIESKYPIGTRVKAEVRNLTNYGAFVELEPGIEGLIRISELSWIKKVSHPSELLKKGEMLETLVLSIDKDKKQINLGIKQLTDNPWASICETMPKGSLVTGKVSKITAFGAFVELDNGIEGLIHVTELSDKPFNKVEDLIAKGDTVTARVMKIDPELKKVALSMKKNQEGANQEVYDDIVLSSEHLAKAHEEKPEGKEPKKGAKEAKKSAKDKKAEDDEEKS